MHEKITLMRSAPPEDREALRQEAEQYMLYQDVQGVLRRQEQLISAQRFELQNLAAQVQAPVHYAVPPTPYMVPQATAYAPVPP